MERVRNLYRLQFWSILAIFVIALSMCAYGVQAAPPSQRSAWCGFTIYGRGGCMGYLTNTDFYVYNSNDSSITFDNDIIVSKTNPSGNAIPMSVNSAASFISFY